MTTPKTSERNYPHINATVDRWMDDWIKGMVQSSGLTYSHIMREIISTARRSGYAPGTVTLKDMHWDAHMRSGKPT